MSFVTSPVEEGVFVCDPAGNQAEMAPFLQRSLIPSVWKGTHTLRNCGWDGSLQFVPIPYLGLSGNQPFNNVM